VDKLDPITAKLVDSGSFGDNNNMVTFKKDGLSERIDYIFTPESLEVMDYSIIESDASDHYPVISILKFVD
jgi:endonuclease/exonuclease/phosphatase family metal-dependent hydrolase